jgi:uncharacterized protein YegL
VLDVSGSMQGEAIEAVKNGVQVLASTLRSDPYALETAHLSVITFESSAKQIVPLTELSQFQMPEINASGGTALGAALSLLSDKIDKEVTKTTPQSKGDWKPLVFLMTDGAPTDEWQNGLAKFKQRKTGVVVACAAGNAPNTDVLKQITEIVVQLEVANLHAFFKWISTTVSASSRSIDTTGTEIGGLSELPPPPPEVNIVV